MKLERAVLTTIEELERLAPEWEALQRRAPSNEPMQSPLWLGAWWRIFGGLDGRALRLLTFRHDGRLVALAPLTTRRYWWRRALPFRRVDSLGFGEDEADEICSEYLDPTVETGCEEPFAAAFAEELTDPALGWDELQLSQLDGSRPLASLLVGALRARGLAAVASQHSVCPYIALPATWEAYLAELPSSRRYLVTRSLRDFDKWAGADARFVTVRAPGELDEGKRILQSLHGERWGKDGDAGVFLSARFAAFHDLVMPALLARSALELSWLSVRGEPIAALYNLAWDNRVCFYQSGRKVDLPKQIRPGIVAHAFALKAAIAAGRREYDFLAGPAQYKLQLATALRPMWTVRVVRAPLRERARQLITWAAAGARRTVGSRSRPT